jgi:hypothetical protein
MLLAFLPQAAFDQGVGVEIDRYCARVPTRPACTRTQRETAPRTYAIAAIGDDTTPAAIGRWLEASPSRGAMDWTRAAEAYAQAHPVPHAES